MEERKWEDTNVDCLVNIFGKVELQSRVQAVPLVCKTWYKALLNPSCWEHLMFPPFIPRQTSQIELMKFVVNRSQRRVTILALPNSCDREVLLYVSEELPALKLLVLPEYVCVEHGYIIANLFKKWKNLEGLMLGHLFVEEIFEPISILPKFALLCFKNCQLDGEAAAAIVSHVPKLKGLMLYKARLKKEDLILIMQGCKELECLDVRNCIGLDENDEDILRLSSGIKHFRPDGSKGMDELYQQMKRLASLTAAEAPAITDTDVDYNYLFYAIDSDDEY